MISIPERAEETKPLGVGKELPDVQLTGIDGAKFSLREGLKDQPAILIFYRGGWCPYCNTQLGQMASIQDSLTAIGFRTFAVSPDRPEELRKSLEKHKPAYTLLSDSGMQAAQAFGIAFRADGATVKKLKGFGMDIEASSGQKHHLLPVPSVFVSDASGVIRFVHADPNYKVRIDPDKLLETARKLHMPPKAR